MKPHLKKSKILTFGGYFSGWVCISGEVIGLGFTPLSAYDNWLEKSLAA